MITPQMARVVVINTTERQLQTIVRKAVDMVIQDGLGPHMLAAALVVAGAEMMVTTGLKDKASYMAVCEAAFDHAMV